MPAQGFDAVGYLQQFVLGREIHQPLDKIEANAPHTSGVQGLQLGIADAALDSGHAARPAV